jgi:hypothetical protein
LLPGVDDHFGANRAAARLARRLYNNAIRDGEQLVEMRLARGLTCGEAEPVVICIARGNVVHLVVHKRNKVSARIERSISRRFDVPPTWSARS